MEFILALIIIIVLCKIFGVSNEMIAMGALVLVELTIIAMTLMFAVMCAMMAFSRKKTASFKRIDKSGGGKFSVAYYEVEGTEYPCFFPSEMILNDKMYRTDRTYKVLLVKRFGRVYDIWTILTCILGFICSGAAVVGSVMFLNMMISY
ncbi:MAG: hypothetical protein IJ874_08420 [Ruminococcus sp.]|nr:hypothetical protein [Ruminococcus sp.]